MQFSANKSPYLRNGARWDHGYNGGLIQSRTHPFDWYQNHRPWMADAHSTPEKMHLLEPATEIWMKLCPYYLRQKC